jgi:hypothetical protein
MGYAACGGAPLSAIPKRAMSTAKHMPRVALGIDKENFLFHFSVYFF